MDKKEFALFLAFSAAVLIAWWAAVYFLNEGGQAPRPARKPQPRAQPPAAEAEEAVAPPDADEATAEAPPPAEAEAPAPAAPPAPPPVEPVEAVLENKLVHTRWTNLGAALKTLRYKTDRYRAPYTVDEERPALALLQEFQEGLRGDTIEKVTFFFTGADGAGRKQDVPTARLPYELVESGPERLVFQATPGTGQGHRLGIRKTITMGPDSYDYQVELEFSNPAEKPFEFTYALRGAAGIERESLQTRYLGVRIGIEEEPGDYDVVDVSSGDLEDGPQVNESTNIGWAGLVNHYFVAVTLPEDRGWVDTVASRSLTEEDLLQAQGPRWSRTELGGVAQRRKLARQNATLTLNSHRVEIAPGQRLKRRYRLVAAPKKDTILKSYRSGLPGLVEYGWLPSVSRLAVWVLNAVHALIPNYGLAILIVTAIIRFMLHPLTRKSQLSFARMQKLQPRIAELQEKYGDDKQKMTQEQMKLWKKYGISPFGGCWPMLLQMPVLISLFGALRAAIELRHSSFLWIPDLSQPDTLFYLPVALPILGNEFNLLPILMGVVMYVNQRFTTQSGGGEQAAQQQAIMKIMPLFLAVIFYNMPSGLCLYFTASTSIGALERWLIQKKAKDIELVPVEERRKKKRKSRKRGKPQKKGFFAKLAELQEKLEDQKRRSRQARRKDQE